jgi:hypothetical protein
MPTSYRPGEATRRVKILTGETLYLREIRLIASFGRVSLAHYDRTQVTQALLHLWQSLMSG